MSERVVTSEQALYDTATTNCHNLVTEIVRKWSLRWWWVVTTIVVIVAAVVILKASYHGLASIVSLSVCHHHQHHHHHLNHMIVMRHEFWCIEYYVPLRWIVILLKLICIKKFTIHVEGIYKVMQSGGGWYFLLGPSSWGHAVTDSDFSTWGACCGWCQIKTRRNQERGQGISSEV